MTETIEADTTEMALTDDRKARRRARRVKVVLVAFAVLAAAGSAYFFWRSDVLTRSKEALYLDGGTVASKSLRDDNLGGGFYLDVDPAGDGLRRVRVEVTEDEWNGIQVGDAFPARSEAAKREAHLSDDKGAQPVTRDVAYLVAIMLVIVAPTLLVMAMAYEPTEWS